MKTIRPRGKRILSNLELVFPESSELWRLSLRCALYDHLGWMITELLVLQKDPGQAFSWIEEVRGAHYIEEAVSRKKGVLFLSGHYGNWELLAAWYAQYLKDRGHDFYIVGQNMRDKDLSALVDRYRENNGIKILPKDTSTLDMVRMLKSGAHIAALADISWVGGVRLPFMGHPCTHTTGPAVLGMLADAPVIPVALYRRAPFRHVVEFFPPVPVPKENNRRLRIGKMTESIVQAQETFIAPQPELWFWLHNRWKR